MQHREETRHKWL